MSEAGAAVLAAAIAAFGSIISTAIAALVAKRTKPISNGFAGSVRTSLKHLEAHLNDVHTDIREVRATVINHIAQDHEQIKQKFTEKNS